MTRICLNYSASIWLRRRRCLWAGLLLFVLACPPFALSALAQQRRPNPSPAAPGDLTKPEYDTTTPVYDPRLAEQKAAQTMVAEVDGRAITLGDVGDAIRALPPNSRTAPFETLYPLVLDRLIQQQALVIRALRQGLDDDPVARRRVKTAADHAMTEELLHKEIGAGITEQMLRDRFDRDFLGKPAPDEVHARIILAKTAEEASSLLAKLRAGTDFAELAKRASHDSTASTGGDLGFRRRDSLNAEIGSVAFALAPGQITAYPINAAGGWFLVRVDERRPGTRPPFEAVRESLFQDALRDGVTRVVEAALKGVTVRIFHITGQEATPEALKPE